MEGMNMNMTAIIVALVSIMGNVIQFLLNKKSSDIKTLNEQVKLLGELQEKQSEAYQREMEEQDKEIKELRSIVNEQKSDLDANKEEMLRLQCLVNRLIGQGCHLVDRCPDRSPYTVDEINEMTNKKSNKNEQRNNGNKRQNQG